LGVGDARVHVQLRDLTEVGSGKEDRFVSRRQDEWCRVFSVRTPVEVIPKFPKDVDRKDG
jgi:hypothetical protein